MGDNYPLAVSCWGRTYQVSTDDEKAELFRYLTEDRKALANRFRVSEKPSRWSQMKRAERYTTWPTAVLTAALLRLKELEMEQRQRVRLDLRCGGFFEIASSFGIADLGDDERVLVSAIADAIQRYRAGCASVVSERSESSAPTPERSAKENTINLDPPAAVQPDPLSKADDA